jgi:hypothetical protein
MCSPPTAASRRPDKELQTLMLDIFSRSPQLIHSLPQGVLDLVAAVINLRHKSLKWEFSLPRCGLLKKLHCAIDDRCFA